MNLKIKTVRFLIFFCLLYQILPAQNITTFTVRGILTDSIERQPLDAANVVIIRAKDSVLVVGGMSDEKGVFEIGKVPAGQYQLLISYLGYHTVMQPLTLSGTPRTINVGGINMQKQNVQIGEVVVAGKFNQIGRAHV